MKDPVEEIREWSRRITPPRFDRVAVRALAMFDSVPRRDYAELGAVERLAGLPVVVDEEVPPGIIQLRKGDEIVETLRVLPYPER